MKIYYNNIIEQAILTPSNSDINQDVNYLKQPQLARSFIFGVTSGNLVIDLGTATDIGYFIVNRGSLTTSATVTLQGNSTDVWTSPTYSASLIKTDTMYYKDLEETFRYWRLVISDSVNIEIGYISMGAGFLQMPGIDPKSTLNYTTTSLASYSVSGQIYGDDNYNYLKTYFSFPQISENPSAWIDGRSIATRKDILDLWNIQKNINPVWVMLFENNLDEYPPLFCIIDQNNIQFTKLDYGKYYSTKINLREVF